MNKQIQGFISGVIVTAVLSGGLAYAKSRTESIEVIYDNIKVYKDNVLCELKDSNGSVIEPFIYNGTTFMPVRGTAQLADMSVTWDGAQKSVYLWDNLYPSGTFLMDVCPPYETYYYDEYSSGNGKSFKMAGEKYSNGFTLGYDGYALFNLNSKYSSIEFTVGHVDEEYMEEADVSFYVDGRLVKELTVDPEGLPKTVSIPVNYGLQLKIVHNGSARTGFGNITVE